MIRRKIVAISGSGRTGSTLLSLLLSQHSDIFNLGQLRDLWAAWASDAPCSCGRPLRGCPVYSVVIAGVFGPEPGAGLEQMRRSMRAFFRGAQRVPDWSADDRIRALGAAHAEFLGRLAAVLEGLQGATGTATFVDASKSPEMALALSLTQGTDLRLLNLVRDPRAVAVSWQRRHGGWLAGWQHGRTWAQRQRQLSRWSRALGDRFLPLRYEDFAADARAAVTRVEHWAGLEPAPDVFAGVGRARISWQRQHLYPPANERVLAERATEVVVSPADDWRHPRHAWQHRLALLASGRDGRRYARGERTDATAAGQR